MARQGRLRRRPEAGARAATVENLLCRAGPVCRKRQSITNALASIWRDVAPGAPRRRLSAVDRTPAARSRQALGGLEPQLPAAAAVGWRRWPTADPAVVARDGSTNGSMSRLVSWRALVGLFEGFTKLDQKQKKKQAPRGAPMHQPYGCGTRIRAPDSRFPGAGGVFSAINQDFAVGAPDMQTLQYTDRPQRGAQPIPLVARPCARGKVRFPTTFSATSGQHTRLNGPLRSLLPQRRQRHSCRQILQEARCLCPRKPGGARRSRAEIAGVDRAPPVGRCRAEAFNLGCSQEHQAGRRLVRTARLPRR